MHRTLLPPSRPYTIRQIWHVPFPVSPAHSESHQQTGSADQVLSFRPHHKKCRCGRLHRLAARSASESWPECLSAHQFSHLSSPLRTKKPALPHSELLPLTLQLLQKLPLRQILLLAQNQQSPRLLPILLRFLALPPHLRFLALLPHPMPRPLSALLRLIPVPPKLLSQLLYFPAPAPGTCCHTIPRVSAPAPLPVPAISSSSSSFRILLSILHVLFSFSSVSFLSIAHEKCRVCQIMFPWNIFLEVPGNTKLMQIQQRSNLLKTLNEALGSIRGEVGVAAQNLARGLLIG